MCAYCLQIPFLPDAIFTLLNYSTPSAALEINYSTVTDKFCMSALKLNRFVFIKTYEYLDGDACRVLVKNLCNDKTT